MSENRRPNTRKNRWWRSVAAVVSTVALGVGGVAVPPVAGAYTPTTLEFPEGTRNAVGDPDGPEPTVQASDASISKVGDGYEATFEGVLTAPQPVGSDGQQYGESDFVYASVILGVTGGSLSRKPTADDFQWEDGVRREVNVLDYGDGDFRVEFKNGDQPTAGAGSKFSVTLPVTPEEGAQKLKAEELVYGRIYPEKGWQANDDADLKRIDGTCSAMSTQSHTFHGGGYGTWLGEIRFGSNLKSIQLGELDLTFRDASGRDITEQILSDAEHLDHVGNVLQDPPAEQFPSVNWQMTLNLPFDSTTKNPSIFSEQRVYYAGTSWIPDGTTVSVTQKVTDRACNPARPTYDRWDDFQHAVFLSSASTDRTAEDYAVDELDLNGPEVPTTTVTKVTTTTEYPDPVTTTVTTTPSSTAVTTQTETVTATTTPTKTQVVPTTTTKQVPTTTTETTTVSAPCDCEPETVTKTETAKPVTETKTETTTVMEPVPTTTTKTEKVPEPVPTTVHTTTTAKAPKRGTIGDKVWEDTNGDGKEDPDEKTGVPDVTVIVRDKDGNEVTRTVTDEEGNWKVDVEPGDYVVEYVPGGHTPSQPDQVKRTVTIKPGEKRDDVDLGVLPSGSVGDRVWVDEDGDGKQGENEKGLENVVVLVSREGEPTRSAVTDANGDWKIEGLNPNAEYDIRFVKPDGWEVTGKVPGSDESGLASKVTVKPGEYNDTYDLGLRKLDTCRECEPVKPGTIGDRVWIDENGDGKEDPDEKTGVPDVTVIVRDKDGNEVTRTVTDEDGNWKVDVEPGDYEIEYRPRDWKPTDPKRVTQKVTVEEGKDYLDLDLGVQKPKPGEPTPPTEKPEKGSSSETLDRCVANAVRSPLLYLVPVALLGAFGGEIARPYMGAINEQVNQINAQFQEAMRRNTPDWGHGGRGGRDNDQFAELRGQIDAANRRIAELGQDPNVQRFGTVAAGIIGLIAAGGVLYDWCSNEKGEAFTSIGGSSAKESGAEGRQSSSKDAA